MPELPDVAVLQRYLDATALHQEIADVEVEDTDVLVGVSPGLLASRLRGCSFASTRRYGKYLFAGTDQGEWVAFHFGMTGFLKYYKREEAAPEHVRLLLEFANGYQLAYDCQRKFGMVGWTEDVDGFVEEKGMGPDPLASDLDLRQFRDRLHGRRGAIKPTLMNQKVLAGIGNVYSDEILFQAGVHPERKIPSLGDDEVEEIYRALVRVVAAAIDAQADPERLPRGYLLPHREEGAECPRCGGTLRKKTVSGRSAYFCEEHQG